MSKNIPFQVGDKVPDFSLQGDDEKTHHLKDFLGKKVVLYFYPKDDTPGCTTEACDFRDRMDRLASQSVVVIGVSPDSPESHRAFKAKHHLSFLLLADPGAHVARAYGAWGQKNMYGKISEGLIRSTFLIDEQGALVKAFPKVSVQGHADAVLATLASAKK